MFRVRFAGILVLTAVVAACSKKPPPAPAPVPVAQPIDSTEIKARLAREAAERDRLAREAAARDSAARVAADVARTNAARAEARRKLDAVIYFDYDVDEVRDDQKATLDAKVPILQANSDIRIRIAGHTDDRGSDEYNLALGQRRAAAVRRYLVSRGLAENRFDVESFGEQRPANPAENEEAWSKNRRAEFELIAGGNPIRVP